MQAKFSRAFKLQAVEKVLSRNDDVRFSDVALSLGVGCSTLYAWVDKSRNYQFESISMAEKIAMTRDKRPQDWSLEEKLNMIIACASLSEEALHGHCREQGVYPHHVTQWKLDLVKGNAVKESVAPGELKRLRAENLTLKREVHRKDKALAETAALLVLQKKVHEIWGSDEDNFE